MAKKGSRRPATSNIATPPESVGNNPSPRIFSTAPVFHIVLIAVFGLLVYSNTLHVPFVFDDESSVVRNHVLKNLHGFLFDGSGYHFNPRRFIGYLSLSLNYWGGGLNVTGYHLFNLAVHILTALSLYGLTRAIFRTPRLKNTVPQDRVNWTAALAALLFVTHPVQTQAVTYIVQRMASLAALFCILALLAYLKGRLAVETSGKGFSGRSAAWYALSLCSALLAMKTKEISFTLPFVVALLEFGFFRNTLRKKLLFLAPLLLCLLVVPLSFWGSDKPLGELLSDVSTMTRETEAISRSDYLLTQFRVIATYLRLLVFPVNQNLDYDYPVYDSFLSAPVFLSFLLLAGLLVLAFWCYRVTRHSSPVTELRLIGFGILWFFIALSVESSLIPIRDVIFEHRLYLPLAGAALAVSTALLWGLRRFAPRTVLILALALGMVMGGTAWRRNLVWGDAETLWKDVIAKSPKKWRPANELGKVYFDRDRLEEAILWYGKAVRLQPSALEPHNNLGIAYARAGRKDEALSEYRQALELDPRQGRVHLNLGILHEAEGEYDEAVESHRRALQLLPEDPVAHFNLAVAYHKKGMIEEALDQYREALRLDPAHTGALVNLGAVHVNLGRLAPAISAWEAALRLDPGNRAVARQLEQAREILTRKPQATP